MNGITVDKNLNMQFLFDELKDTLYDYVDSALGFPDDKEEVQSFSNGYCKEIFADRGFDTKDYLHK